jgi:hypothetical protein
MDEPHKRLRQAREQAGYITASEAARALRMNVSTYINHEGGERDFYERMPVYARFFRVKLEWLMTGRGTMTGNPIEQLIADLPPGAQREAITYLEFLKSRSAE